MRVAVLSDIHGNLPALEAVVRDFRGRGVDAVLNLGDSLSGPLLPLETARFLMAQNWLTIAGNHERQVLAEGPGGRGRSDAYTWAQLSPRELTWVAALPGSAHFTAEVRLCHGTPGNDLDSLLETITPNGARVASAQEVETRLGQVRQPVVLCGHTHVPRILRSPSGQLLVNPGSVGLQALASTLPCPHVVETGSPDARYAILERRAGSWQAALISAPYDGKPMATLAIEHGRPDWACALRSGYMA